MKKTILFAFLITFFFSAQSQDSLRTATPVAVDTLPAELCIPYEGEKICVPTGDAKVAGELIIEFIRSKEGNLPKNVGGWLLVIIEFLTGATGVVFLTKTKNVVAFLKVFLKKKINVVVFIAGLAATGITFLIGKGQFDGTTFAGVWGILGLIAVAGYENLVKKPVVEEPKA